MPRDVLIQLSAADVDSILALERKSFPPPLQAKHRTVLDRFRLGHTMIGARDEGRLAGMIAFSYARFSPDDYASFPKTFAEFSSRPVPRKFNAVFIYSLGVDHEKRGGRFARLLLAEALDQAKRDGCTYAVGDGRISTYQGSQPCEQEHVRRSAVHRAAIDRYLAGGAFPTKEEFLADSTLALYHRVTGCDFLWVIPDFVPQDRAAGGVRVIVYGHLARWTGRRQSPALAGAV